MPSPAQVVFCTVPDAETGASLANTLLASKLAACVNMLPGVTSFYEWQGEMQRDPELLLMIKTRPELLPALRDAITAQHPYDVPEVIAVDVPWGHQPYLDWIAQVTHQADSP